MKTKEPKKPRVRELKPGQAEYLSEVIKPGMTRVEAARRAGLSTVPASKGIETVRKAILKRGMTIAEITAERVILGLARLAFADPKKLKGPDGSFLSVEELDEDTRAALSVEWMDSGESGITVRYKFVSAGEKRAALDTLAKLQFDMTGKLKMPEGNGGALTPATPGPVFNIQFVQAKLENGSAAHNQ